MDTFSADRKLSELGDLDLQDFLIDQPNDLVFGGRHAGEAGGQTGTGMSSRHQDLNGDCSEYTCYKMDSGWLDNFLDDDETSACVTTVANYNDVLTTSGLDDESLQLQQQQQQPEHVKCEHSYSLADDNNMEDQLLSCLPSCNAPGSPHAHDEVSFDIKTEEADEMDMDAGLFNLINPDLTLLADSDASTCSGSDVDCDGIQTSPSAMVAAAADVFQSVFTSCSSDEDCDDLMMNGQVKTEPLDVCTTGTDEDGSFTTIESDFFDVPDMLDLPPTPPSSSSCSSDSEAGGLSPRRSSPSSPIHLPPYQTRTHHVLLSGHHHHQHQQQQHSGSNMWTASSSSSSSSGSQSLFSSPIPSSGILVLSEEEKRTLVAEGYPIPTKLPLTKQEEKNLKKIRRKIKNKISAQESRRKKKEYLEHLEKRVELVSMENLTLRKKLDSLETNNRSLASQLQKLQSLASRVTAEMQAATCITVS